MQDRTSVIRAGRLIDGTTSGVQHDQAIFVDGGTITRVGPAASIPEGADVLDLSDATVLPGLIDCHVHLVFSASNYPLGDVLVEDDQQLLLRCVAAARQALRAGITTVRDLGGRGGVTFRVRDAIDKGWITGPRIHAAGSPITITGGHCHFLGLEADGEDGVRHAARWQLKAGANCLKIMSTGGRMTPGTNIHRAQYSVEEIGAAVDEAARRGVTVAAHGLGTDGIRNAVQAGVNTIEHCNWLGFDTSVALDENVAALMAERDIAMVPTLVPLARTAPVLREAILGAMRRARQLGAPIAAGTDAGVSTTPFDSLPSEISIMVRELGLSPLDAICAATSEAARAIGVGDNVGTLKPGLAADMLVVEGDPSATIDDLRRVRLVIKGGRKVVEHGVVLD